MRLHSITIHCKTTLNFSLVVKTTFFVNQNLLLLVKQYIKFHINFALNAVKVSKLMASIIYLVMYISFSR